MISCLIEPCEFSSTNLRDVINHMRNQHVFEQGLSIPCAVGGCASRFSTTNALRLHVLRLHKNEWDRAGEISMRDKQLKISPSCAAAGPINELEPTGDTSFCENNTFNITRSELAIKTFNSMMSHSRKAFPALFLRLKYKYNIPRSISRLIHDDYISCMRDVWEGWSSALNNYSSDMQNFDDLTLKTIMQCQELGDIFKKSAHDELAQLRKLGWVRPVEINVEDEAKVCGVSCNPLDDAGSGLDDDANVNDNDADDLDGDINTNNESNVNNGRTLATDENEIGVPLKKEVYHYVPLLETLKSYLKHDDVVNEILRGGSIHQGDGIYEDFTSGLIYAKTHRFTTDPHHLRIALYTDEVTVTNPLAAHSRKHKLAVVYFMVNNIRPNFLSSPKSIHLVLASKWKLVQKYSYSVIFRRLIEDLKSLQNDGIDIKTLTGRTLHFTGSLAFISADNLSAHALGGFRCTFSSGKLCRNCLVDYRDMKSVSCAADCTIRVPGSIKRIAALVKYDPLLTSVYGIVSESCFFSVEGFDPLLFLPPDVLHDVLECFMPTHVGQLARVLHKTKVLPFEEFQKLVSSFKYAKSDAANKFPGFAQDWIKKQKNAISGTAAEKWALFRLLPFMIGHKIPVGNEHWELFTLALQIADIILAFKVSDARLTELANLIDTHHKMWVRLYPDVFPAKFHYLVHYPRLMQQFGPLRLLWCMRFESFHQILKQIVQRARNFINETFTATERFQKRRCIEYANSCGLPPALTIKSSQKTVLLRDVQPLRTQECVARVLKCAANTALNKVKDLTFQGHSFHVGSFNILRLYCDEIPVFFKIDQIFVLGEKIILCGFLVAIENFNQHLQAYQLTSGFDDNDESYTAISPYDLRDPAQTMDSYEIAGVQYLRYRYRTL